MRWLAAHTWFIALVPLVIILVLSGYFGRPLNLLKDTEVDYLNKDSIFALYLLSDGQERSKTIKYEVQTERGERILLYLQKDSLTMPKLGDILMVQTSVKRGGRLGEFDYGLYLRRQGIVGTCWAHRGNWQVIGKKEDSSLKSLAQRCQSISLRLPGFP